MDERREKIMAMSDEQFRVFVDEQLRAGGVQFEEHRTMLAANTALTQEIATSTREIVSAFTLTKSGVHFFSVLGRWLNRFARWVAPIITLAAILWALMHGQWPKAGE